MQTSPFNLRSCHMRQPVATTYRCDTSPRQVTSCDMYLFMQFDAVTFQRCVEFKSVWIHGTRHGDKMLHAHSVPSCDMHLRHVAATTVNKPITGLPCNAILIVNSLPVPFCRTGVSQATCCSVKSHHVSCRWSLVGVKVCLTTNSPNTVHTFCSGQDGRIKVKIFGALMV